MLNNNMYNNTKDTISNALATPIGLLLIEKELNELKDFVIHSFSTHPLVSALVLSLALNGYLIWKACKAKRKRMFPHHKTAA